jgi:large repetitive protein
MMINRDILKTTMTAVLLASCSAKPDITEGDPGQTQGWVSSRDDSADVPTFLWALEGDSQVEPGTDAVAAARAYLGEHAAQYRLSPTQIAELVLVDDHNTGRGARVVRFSRKVGGIEVLGESVSIAMTPELQLLAITGYVTGDMPAAQAARSADPAKAMQIAISDLAGVAVKTTDLEKPRAAASGPYQESRLGVAAARLAAASPTAPPMRAKQVYVRGPGNTLLLAHYVEAHLGDDVNHRPRSSAYVIAADDSRVVQKHSLVFDATPNPFTYRVHADPTGAFVPYDNPTRGAGNPSPNNARPGVEPPLLPGQLITLSSLTQFGITDPWLPVGATETRGNNVDAYLDLDKVQGFSPDGGDSRGVVSSPGRFDHAIDFNLDANATRANALAGQTNAFYVTNWLHDYFYAAGFTEVAGNAQASNFGRGGLGNDPLLVEGQDSSGFDGANIFIPSDGSSPRLQVFNGIKKLESSITVTAPAELAGVITQTGGGDFAPLNFTATGDIVLASPINACTPLVGDYVGKIVFVDRGTCSSIFKVINAEAAGAIGVIQGQVIGSPGGDTAPAVGAPAGVPFPGIGFLNISITDGNRFRTALASGPGSGTITRRNRLVDGQLDNSLLAHEWGHYLTNRLIANGAGLQRSNPAIAIGEGLSDVIALLITVQADDILVPTNTHWNGAYSIFSHGVYEKGERYYSNSRRYPYSTDLTLNPLTFKHIGVAGVLPALPVAEANTGALPNNEVHNAGEVLAVMLWESYAALLRDTLGSNPRLTFDQARDRMRDYLVTGLKLMPDNPTFTEVRDAILLAARANDPIDFQRFGAAFARRGAGVNAVAPPRGTLNHTPIVESFAFGPALQQVGATLTDAPGALCNQNGLLDNGETGTLTVTFRNVGSANTRPIIASVTAPAGITFPNGNALKIPHLRRGEIANVALRVRASGLAPRTRLAVVVETPDAGAGEVSPVTYTFDANADQAPGISRIDTVESSIVVWQTSTSTPLPSAGNWRRVQSDKDNHAFRVEGVDFAATSELTSPRVTVSSTQPLTLSFKHRHSFEYYPFQFLAPDVGVIEISSDDGATWNDLFDLGFDVPYTDFIGAESNPLFGRAGFGGETADFPTYQPVTVNLGTGFAGQSVRLRFRIATDTAGDPAEGFPGTPSYGWEVDDIELGGVVETPFPAIIDRACNLAPTANAGPDQHVLGARVQLAGKGSDPELGPVTFKWTAPPPIQLSNPNIANPTFIAPVGTSVTLSLIVTDDKGLASAPDTVVVTRRKVTAQ